MDILAGNEKEGKRESVERHGHSENRERAGEANGQANGQRRKSLILNGKRTDIARELEIGANRGGAERDGGRGSRGIKRIYRDPMRRIRWGTETVSSRSKKRKEGRKKEMEEWKRKGKNVRRWNRDKNRSDPCHISILAESRDTILFTRR